MLRGAVTINYAIACLIMASLWMCTEPKPEPETETETGNEPDSLPEVNGEVLFHNQSFQYEQVECYISGTVGGPTTYSLSINFVDSLDRSINFSIQDAENDPAKLSEIGLHRATGGFRDGINNRLTSPHFLISSLDETQLSLTWEHITVEEYTFSGNGYISVHERIELECADSVWVGGRFAYPGDIEYDSYFESYCEPEYFYPSQKILFECQDGRRWG